MECIYQIFIVPNAEFIWNCQEIVEEKGVTNILKQYIAISVKGKQSLKRGREHGFKEDIARLF